MKLSPTQRRWLRKTTKEHNLDPSEMTGELNIVPLLDVIMNLIVFMMATMATVYAFMMIQTEMPTLRSGIGSRSQIQENTLNLNVTITAEGVIVTGSGAKLTAKCGAPPGSPDASLPALGQGRVITVAVESDGRYDWARLTRCLAEVKERFPDEDQVIISADPLVHYEHVVAAMDASRAQETTDLFPNVILSAGVR
jgi:biopolymer transport protein TolR